MKRIVRFISFLVLVMIITGCGSRPNPFELQVRALLNETGVSYELKGCYGGWVAREMYCDLMIKADQINNFADKLGLMNSLPYFPAQRRLIIVPDNQDPSASFLREKYRDSLGVQQWVPTRHGFASAILFYNKKNERGCLYLCIAYG